MNPGTTADTTEIPLSLYYHLPILGYTNQFTPEKLSNPVEYLKLLLAVTGITVERLLQHSVYVLLNGDFQAFVTHFNNQPDYSTYERLSVNLDNLDHEVAAEIATHFQSNEINLLLYIMEQHMVVENDVSASFDNLFDVFEGIVGSISAKEILELFIPVFSASIRSTNLALEFPRKWLKPVDANGNRLAEDVKSRLTYEVGSLSFHSKKGFEFNQADSFSFDRSEIGNTGLIIEFENLKVDLSNSRNIPEADRDGRAEDFKGVYAEYAAITLPKKWFKKSNTADTARIAGYDLLIGNGGISGALALEVLLLENTDGTITDYYQDHFTLDYPLSVKRTDPTTKKQQTIKLADHAELVAHYNLDHRVNFAYPVSLTDKRNNEKRKFEKAADYNAFLTTLDTSVTPRIGFDMNGFEVGFTSFDITFHQGKIVESNIKGLLKIPKLKDTHGNEAEIIVTGHYNDDGDFSLTFTEEDGIPFGIPDVADVIVKSLAYVREDGRGYLEVGADIAITNNVIKKLFCDKNQVIPLPNLRFYANPASFEIVGGTLAVPENFSLCLGPVEVSITNIDHGTYQRPLTAEEEAALGANSNGITDRKYKYWGFNGAISVDPLGLDVRGDGIKYYYSDDNEETGLSRDSFIHIKTVEVDLIIPGDAKAAEATAIINGYLSIPSPGESPEYSGGIKLKMPQAKISGSAEMRLAPKFPAFIVDASIDLPSGIPLGPTGLEITGFRGLLGFRYVAEKEAIGLESGKDTWYDYYTYPDRGINIQKFSNPSKTGRYKNPVSLGAGATIDTVGPNVISTRVMMLLSIPSLFIIDGRASILSKEWGLDDSGEPPFSAFMAIGDQSIEIGVGADLKLPQDTGAILQMVSNTEAAFFFRDSSAWYVNGGTKERPNTSRALSLVTVQSYLQLSAKGIAMGSRGEFTFERQFGPAKVKSWLFIEIGGKISFERPQIGGYIEAGGGVEAKFFGVKAGATLNAILSAEAPKPFLIFAQVRLCGRLPFIRKKICLNVKLKWEKSRVIDKSPIPPLLPEKANEQVKGVHMLTGETFDLVELGAADTPASGKFEQAVIPLDTYVDIKFTKAVLPAGALRNKIGGFNNPAADFTELIPPVQTVKGGKSVRQVKHQYRASDISIECWNGTAWEVYHPYQAVNSKEDQPPIPANEIGDLKIGHWQKTRKAYDKIRLLANNPFSYTQQGEEGWTIPEEFGITDSTLFCEGTKKEPVSTNWLNRPRGQKFYVPGADPDAYYTQGQLYFQILGRAQLEVDNIESAEYAEVASAYSPFDFAQSLKISNANSIALKFPNPVKKVTLKLSTWGRGVSISGYKMILPQAGEETTVPVFEQLPGDELFKSASELYEEVVFESDVPFSKVVIDPVAANEQQIRALEEQIAQLINDAYQVLDENGDATELVLSDEVINRYEQLVSELEEARALGCSIELPPACGIGAMEIENTLIVDKNAFEGNNVSNPFETPFGNNQAAKTGEEATSKCYTLLHEVSWLSEADEDYNLNIPGQAAIEADFLDSVKATKHIADPIWRPDTHYRIQFTLSDTVDNGRAHTYTHYYGFRTAGPLGHYHNANGVVYGGARDDKGLLINPSQYPLTTLRSYIDYQRSYPNANGSLLLAKPLFYGTEVGDDGTGIGNNEVTLFFNRPYLYHMMDNWGSYQGKDPLLGEMQIIIKDPTENVTHSNPPQTVEELEEVPGGTAAWSVDEFPQLQSHVTLIQNMLDGLNANGDKCTLNLGEAIIPKSFKRTIKVANLKPQKLYTVIVNNIYEGVTAQVHDFGFQTSRYRNFDEQVKSYELKAKSGELIGQATFDLRLETTEEAINKVYEIAANQNSSDLLSSREADAFDHVIEGILNLPPLNPATSTEFNKLCRANGEVFAVLIRNPEPFNDPKIPLAVIRDQMDTVALTVRQSNDMIDNAFKVLYSKDYSEALILKQADNKVVISEEALKFRFRYLRWDGNSYVVKSNVETDNISISK